MTPLERRELPHVERPRIQSKRSFAKSTCIVGLSVTLLYLRRDLGRFDEQDFTEALHRQNTLQ